MIEKCQREDGFTIVEILIALVLSSILIFFIFEIFTVQNKLQVDENQKLTLQQDGRATLNILTNGLRLAGYSPKASESEEYLSGMGQPPGLIKAAINELSYSCDLNENGSVDPSEIFTYRLSGTTLERLRGGSADPEPLLENVAAFTILYAWDNEGKGSSSGYGDLEPPGSLTHWGFDSNDDGALDLRFTAENGVLVSSNDSDGNPSLAAPAAVNPTVPLKKVRGARIWILLASQRERQLKITGDVASQLPTPGIPVQGGALDVSALESDKGYRVFSSTVKLRNMYFF